jgi:thiol:disulfide interchange protein DsbD
MKFKAIPLFVSLVYSIATFAQELLPSDQAYQVAVQQIGQDVVAFTYRIAPGYILYRDRFVVALAGAPGHLEVALPPAMSMIDRTTHRQAYYYSDQVTMMVKLPPGSVKTAKVTASAQGCAIYAGVCYPVVKTTWVAQGNLDVESIMPEHAGSCPAHAPKIQTIGKGGSGASC